MPREDISFKCNDLELQGILEYPESGERQFPGAVVCHPHPLYGGNMFNNVVKAVKNTLLNKGYVCLRFNFRGAGQSAGTYDEGNGERDDVRAALDYLESLDFVNRDALIVSGYSFGCWVSMNAMIDDPRPQALIGISPPLDMYDFSFLKTEKRPKMLISGDRDFVCSVDNFKRVANEIPEPKLTFILAGVDHFHAGSENLISEKVDEFLKEYPIGS